MVPPGKIKQKSSVHKNIDFGAQVNRFSNTDQCEVKFFINKRFAKIPKCHNKHLILALHLPLLPRAGLQLVAITKNETGV
jgi:hypothetical protein